ncbi:polysaccharide biosynthesis protein [Psychrosphaera aquimarina]|uniref:polysaccharide biosynthesis protein n=1 Tax=Psychrosphaera aquimarina TaxID=2044854 RepID=UPI003D180A4A
MLNILFNLPRSTKRLVSVFTDMFFLSVSFFLAFFARLESTEIFVLSESWFLLSGILFISVASFVQLGLYRAVLRYMNLHAMWAVFTGVVISVVTFIALSFIFNIPVPRTVPFLYGCFALILLGGSRLVARSLIGRHNWHKKESVLIYGAGSAGRQLATALTQGAEYFVSAFIEDDKNKHGSIIQGIRVYSNLELRALINKLGIKSILLALPSTTISRRKEILSHLEHLPVRVLTIPGFADIVSGKATVSQFKDVEIEDLLGRDAVTPNQQLLTADITNKVVMVTGAGGSIGSELCRQIIRQKPSKLVLFERSEFALYSIDKEIQELKIENDLDIDVLPIVGSVQRINRIETVMKSFQVETVYHAAAYKHVPLVEHNVVEGIRNNVFGTYHAAKAAINAGVSTFVLISTDKAVRPTNVMGTTKRLAELVLQALSKTQESTRFCMVRFGNVLGSSGSVVPLFRRQIKDGGPITLTHKDITRYFMTIPEAAQLVIQAGAMGKGGDVFVLDMGDSVKIIDLAEKMIRLSGLTVKDDNNPDGDIEILCTGLRPGEKLYEELLIGDNVSGTHHERIMSAQELMLPWSEVEDLLNKLDTACHAFDHEELRRLIIEAPTGFNPTDGICDLVWKENQKVKNTNKGFLKSV